MYWDGFARRADLYDNHMVSSSSLCKNKDVLTKHGGETGTNIIVVSAVCHSWTWRLSAFVSGWGYLISFLHLPPWVWVIPFDLSSALCLITMTSDLLMSDNAKSTVVPPICSREVDLFKVSTFLWFSYDPDSQKHYVPLSHVYDVGNIMAHLRSRSLPVDFSSLSRKLI